MPALAVTPTHRLKLRSPRHSTLLTTVSALALAVLTSSTVQARPVGASAASSSATSTASSAAVTGAAQAASTAEQSIKSLSRATQALQAMQAAQAAASNSSVPNGLTSGGLVPDSSSTWTGANTPTQTISSGTTTVTVVQTQEKAIAYWSTFNVGANTILYFNQSAGTQSDGSNSWAILNRIAASGVPSQILGQIKAEGAVYVINKNGIIFGAGSQVNVNTLVASSLCLFSCTEATSNSRFLNGGIGDLTSSNASTNSILFTSDATTTSAIPGDVTVEKGASITGGAGGLVLIAAPNVTNRGTIQVGDGGQIALIAGIGVSYDYNASSLDGQSTTQFTDDSSTTFLRFANYGKLTDSSGNDITPVGRLINDDSALIYAPTGNITLLGGTIAQNGVVAATTSVSRPGSIIITAAYEVGTSANGVKSLSNADMATGSFYTGAVSFGANSVTTILADSGGETILHGSSSLSDFDVSSSFSISTTTKLPTSGLGLISVIGQSVDLKGGSLLYAPGQYIGIAADVLKDGRVGAVSGSGRVTLESGAVVDVSGLPDVEVSLSNMILTVTLTANDLADSPLQSALVGKTITVDLTQSGTRSDGESWVGTPLANLTSYLNLVEESINQVLTKAGSVYIYGPEVVAASGSIVNLTGGYIRWTGTTATLSRVIGADGRIYDIADADPSTQAYSLFSGFTVDHSRWNVTESWTDSLVLSPRYIAGFIEGGDAGNLIVGSTGGLVLDGTVLAESIAGIRQVSSSSLPSNGTLSITSSTYGFELGTIATLTEAGLVLQALGASDGSDGALLSTSSSYTTNVLDTDALTTSDYSAITVTSTAGGIVLDAGATLKVHNRGAISLSGTAATINGTLTAHSGTVSVTSIGNTGVGTTSNIVVGTTGVIDVSGVFTNDSGKTGETAGASDSINGGTIELVTNAAVVSSGDYTGNIVVENGAELNASSGAYISTAGKVRTTSAGLVDGEGGNISLITYSGITLPITDYNSTNPHGQIEIGDGATITALGFTGGGTLTLQALAIQVGGDPATTAKYGYYYYFNPTWWGDRGFSAINLTSVWETVIPAGATITLSHNNLVADAGNFLDGTSLTNLATGAKLGDVLAAETLPTYYRSPTNLSITAGLELSGYRSTHPLVTLHSTSYLDDEVLLGEGASITADPGASVSLASYDQTTVLGDITARGGSVTLATVWNDSGDTPMQVGSLFVGKDAVIDVSGTVVLNTSLGPVWDAASKRSITPVTGKIYSGGTITLNAPYFPILVQKGATFNVSGTSGSYDVKESNSATGLTSYVQENRWSDAGTVAIIGNNDLLFEGTLIGKAGSSQAEGGTLTITGQEVAQTLNTLVLVDGLSDALAAAGITFDVDKFSPYLLTGKSGYYSEVAAGSFVGAMLFDVSVLANSGFTSLNLTSAAAIDFTGAVKLSMDRSITMTAAYYTALANVYLGYFNGESSAVSSTTRWTDGTSPSLSLSAPYIGVLSTKTASASAIAAAASSSGSYGSSSMTLTAGTLLDIGGSVALVNVADASFISRGDIRLLPATGATTADTMLNAALVSGGDITLEARRIYPATNTLFVIQSLASNGTVTFGYPDGETANTATPLSVGGAVVVDAVNIVQDGNVVAPYGSIILGLTADRMTDPDFGIVALDYALYSLLPYSSFATTATYAWTGKVTSTVTLGAGSVTSVSAGGAILPYGATVDDTDWSYGTRVLDGAPSGMVALTGGVVTVASGAKLDLSGGGDVYATEFVAGTGGSRNVLKQTYTSYTSGSSTGTTVSLYADGRAIYAIVPGIVDVSVYDATMMNNASIKVGSVIYLNGSTGLPAGYYTLLPAAYATMPGAYRVVVNTSAAAVSASQTSYTLADGTQVVTGYTADSLTGARSSTPLEFYVQSGAVWKRYSEYDYSTANQYFTTLAATNGTALGHLPVDAGRLVIDIVSSLSVADGTVVAKVGSFTASDGTTVTGKGAELDIGGGYIEINTTGVADTTGYSAISTDALSAINAESILIGGIREVTDNGLLITPSAYRVIIDTTSDHPLEAAEVMIVAKPTTKTTTTGALDSVGDTATVTVVNTTDGSGSITIRSGSVIQATGTTSTGYGKILIGFDLSNLQDISGDYTTAEVHAASSSVITALQAYYKELAEASAAFVRVSNGAAVTVQTPTYAQLHPALSVSDTSSGTTVNDTIDVTGSYSPGTIPLAGSVSIAGGATVGSITTSALAIVSLANTKVAAAATLAAKTMLLVGDAVTLVDSGAYGGSGLVVGHDTLGNIAAADSVTLQSLGTLTFSGDVSLAMTADDSSLTLDAVAIVGSGGGTVSLRSAKAAFADSYCASATCAATPATGTGTLAVNSGEIDFKAGMSALSGFGTVSLAAAKGMVGSGTGTIDLGKLNVSLTTPIFIAAADSDQTLTTTGALTLERPADSSAALTSSDLGGAITLEGSSVTVATIVEALSGKITLTASAGDVTLAKGGKLLALGELTLYEDEIEAAAGGIITLKATGGTVTLASGSRVAFGGTLLGGNAGSLSITTTGSAPITLAGTILGSAASGYIGGSLLIDSAAALDLNALTDTITIAGITNQVYLRSQTGDLTLSAGRRLTAFTVDLVADGGPITINGTIDASGRADAVDTTHSAGGTIDLWGKTGVTLTGSLLAKGAAAGEAGGTVEIGTSATYNSANGTNAKYGYETITSADSGLITIADTATIDVSAGSGGTGGTVLIRAPLLKSGGVNVAIGSGAALTGASAATVEEYATWSTTDSSTGALHFDGIIDPAGWYSSAGTLLAGKFYNSDGTLVATWTGTTFTLNTVPTKVTGTDSSLSYTTTYSWNSTTDTLTATTKEGTTTTTTTLCSGASSCLAYYLTYDYFTPTTYNNAHRTFYGWTNTANDTSADAAASTAGTLMGFIQNTSLGTIANVTGKSGFTQTVGIDLVNPSGDIKVLTNWNLGAENASGVAMFRTNTKPGDTTANSAAAAPYVTLRASGNLIIDASISDGFSLNGSSLVSPKTPGSSTTYDSYSDATTAYNDGTTISNGSTNSALGFYNWAESDIASNVASGNYDWPTGATLSAPLQPVYISGSREQYYSMYATFYLRAYIAYANDVDSAALVWQLDDSYHDANTADSYVVSLLAAANKAYSSTNLASYATYALAYISYVDYFAFNAYSSTLPYAPLLPPSLTTPAAVAQNTAITKTNLTNAPDLVTTASNVAPIAAMSVASGVSSSYRLVAGAEIGSADPLDVKLTTSDNVIIDDHTMALVLPVGLEAPLASGYSNWIAVPTTVRTGTGSISIAASGDFVLADTVAPGTVITAGAVASEPSQSASVAYSANLYTTVTSNMVGASYILTAASASSGGGKITIAVGGDISGMEIAGSSSAGQMWSEWLLSDKANGWYVNFGSFSQGILSLGGNITVKAGGDIRDLSVSEATTGIVTTASDGTRTLAVTGGGNMLVQAVGSIYSGAYYEGSGSATISAGDAIASDDSYFYYTGSYKVDAVYDVATLLAYQYGSITATARGDVDIGGVFNPTYLVYQVAKTASCSGASSCTYLTPYVASTDANAAVTIASSGGDIAFNTLTAQGLMFGGGGLVREGLPNNASYALIPDVITSILLPASLTLVSHEGAISIEYGGGLYPSSTGTLAVLAQDDISFSNPLDLINYQFDGGAWIVGNIPLWMFGKLAYGAGVLPTPTDPDVSDLSTLSAKGIYDSGLIVANADPVRIISLNGDILNGAVVQAGQSSVVPAGTLFGALLIEPNAPAEIYAGGNIVDLAFYGTNFTANDVTSIIAGGDITYRTGTSTTYAYGATPIIEIAGPGSLIVQAGGDIDFPSQRVTGYETGIRTLGNSLDTSAMSGAVFMTSDIYLDKSYLETFGNPYLPQGGASVTVLAGVGKGVDYTAFETAYLNPATATVSGFLADFASYVADYEAAIGKSVGTLSGTDAWALYQTFSEARQEIIARKVFFDILDQTGKDYNDSTSAYYHQYARGYAAIDTLFPAAYGYTANSLDGGSNGASRTVSTGSIDMRGSTIQTRQGGDIAILAPGGKILVGSSAASPATDPASEGIITLEQGAISIFADQSILVAQSRIFTEQGGDLTIWSSNADIDAGRGAKTSVSFPPPTYLCDLGWYCVTDVKGAVTGAGIATLQSLADVAAGDVNLMAPRGTVDAGAAGIRVSGNLNIAALFVLNSYNIQVQGVAAGIPVVQGPPVAALTMGNNQAAATQQVATPTQQKDAPASIIIVEFLGFGGGDGSTPAPDQQRKRDKQSSNQYDDNGIVRFLGNGSFTADQLSQLTPEERSNVAAQISQPAP